MSRAAVFLDRDGVLNRALRRDGKPVPPATVEELEIMPGARQALEELRGAGFLLIVVSNQPDVARGTQTRQAVEQINERLRTALPLDEIRVCWHDDRDGCGCRKPAPGLLTAAAEEHGISLPASFMVGDRWRDIEAGQRAGTRTVFIDHHYDERQPAGASAVVGSIAEAAAWILSNLP